MDDVICTKTFLSTFGEDDRFMKEMIIYMRADMNECSDLLASAHREKNSDAVRKIAHRVKGQAANIFAKKLHFVSSKLEDASTQMCYTRNEYLMLVLAINHFVRCTKSVSLSNSN